MILLVGKFCPEVATIGRGFNRLVHSNLTQTKSDVRLILLEVATIIGTRYSQLAYLRGDLAQWSASQLVSFFSSLDGCRTYGLQEDRGKNVVEDR